MKFVLTFLGVLSVSKKFSTALIVTISLILLFYALDAYRENFEGTAPKIRYVRIINRSIKGEFLHVTNVRVLDDKNHNRAFKKKVIPSSVYKNDLKKYGGQNIVDGRTTTFGHTNNMPLESFTIDLGTGYDNLKTIEVFNRKEAKHRIKGVFLELLDEKKIVAFSFPFSDVKDKYTFDVPRMSVEKELPHQKTTSLPRPKKDDRVYFRISQDDPDKPLNIYRMLFLDSDGKIMDPKSVLIGGKMSSVYEDNSDKWAIQNSYSLDKVLPSSAHVDGRGGESLENMKMGHTKPGQPGWIELEFRKDANVQYVLIQNRPEKNLWDRFVGARVEINGFDGYLERSSINDSRSSYVFNISMPTHKKRVSYFRISQDDPNKPLNIPKIGFYGVDGKEMFSEDVVKDIKMSSVFEDNEELYGVNNALTKKVNMNEMIRKIGMGAMAHTKPGQPGWIEIIFKEGVFVQKVFLKNRENRKDLWDRFMGARIEFGRDDGVVQGTIASGNSSYSFDVSSLSPVVFPAPSYIDPKKGRAYMRISQDDPSKPLNIPRILFTDSHKKIMHPKDVIYSAQSSSVYEDNPLNYGARMIIDNFDKPYPGYMVHTKPGQPGWVEYVFHKGVDISRIDILNRRENHLWERFIGVEVTLVDSDGNEWGRKKFGPEIVFSGKNIIVDTNKFELGKGIIKMKT